ncbi:MAG TPA: GNAT family N-acetyltransferase [Candidatus Manganitrophaceae bacterium]|nr:GNAT family N-acetyltransferase [Candidatus Manganitrophaceae bacterium]
MALKFSDHKEIDVTQVLELYRNTDWAKDRTAEEARRVLSQSSLVLSLWDGERLVALARVLTDFIFRAAIYDVMVRPDAQRKGIGRLLIGRLLSHPSLNEVPVFHLLTKDKRLFYEKLGFLSTDKRGLDAMIYVREIKVKTGG